MSNDKLIPELRFPEFVQNGDWECNELGNYCEITTGKLDANAMVENGNYRFYTCAKDYYFIDDYAFDTNALLISGNGAHVGYIHHYNGKFNAYQRTYVLDNFNKDIHFIQFFLERNLKSRIATEKKEGNTPYIVKSTLSEMTILSPKSVIEQQKIASCLSSLDDLITAHNEKLEALKDHKKGLMQNLFPQEGETVPKYRFPEFDDDGDWVKVALSSKISVIDGDRGVNYPKSDEYSSNDYCVFLSAKNVTKNGFLFNEVQFITKEKDGLLRKGKLSRFDIVLTTRGSLGQFAYYDENVQYENIRINSGMVILRTKDTEIDSKYLYSYLKSSRVQSAIKSQGFGNAVQQLTVVVINNFELNYPLNIVEQQKIASCLSSLDALITAQSEKIEQLKLHKKGLMQDLFPSIS